MSSREAKTDTFARILEDSIDETNLTLTADRLVADEASVREWRKGAMPNFRTLMGLRFSQAELCRLLRIVANGKAVIEPIAAGESSSCTPHLIHSRLIELSQQAQAVHAAWLSALSGGAIAVDQQRSIDAAIDALSVALQQLRPSRFAGTPRPAALARPLSMCV